MTEEQIKHMVNRFLGWKLPDSFNPDGGISFKRTFNEHTAQPMKAEPMGTNLFDFEQATEMVRYLIEGLPRAEPVTLAKRPVAFRLPEKDGWTIVQNEEAAQIEAEHRGIDYQGLYVRDGS